MNGPDSCCPPPDGAEDATFLQALRPVVVQAWIERQLADGATVSSVQPAYVRWKERDGSLIGYRVTWWVCAWGEWSLGPGPWDTVRSWPILARRRFNGG